MPIERRQESFSETVRGREMLDKHDARMREFGFGGGLMTKGSAYTVSSSSRSIGGGAGAGFGGTGGGAGRAGSIVETREREKRDMIDLNDRLAGYVEKVTENSAIVIKRVRFLEAQNRKLQADLEALKAIWENKSSGVRELYESEIASARKLIDDTEKAKKDLGGRIGDLKKEIDAMRKRYEDALKEHDADREKISGHMKQLGDAEAEIALMRRKVELLDEDAARFRHENAGLSDEIMRARSELDAETLSRIEYQNQVEALKEEIKFMKGVHDQEIKEIYEDVTRDTTPENQEYFRNELAEAIKDIRAEFDTVTANNRSELDRSYRKQVQEITVNAARNKPNNGQVHETRRLKVQIDVLRQKLADIDGRNTMLEKHVGDLTYQIDDDKKQYDVALGDREAQLKKLRDETSTLINELQQLLQTKQTLDSEIAIYRTLLDGETDKEGLKQVVAKVSKSYGGGGVGGGGGGGGAFGYGFGGGAGGGGGGGGGGFGGSGGGGGGGGGYSSYSSRVVSGSGGGPYRRGFGGAGGGGSGFIRGGYGLTSGSGRYLSGTSYGGIGGGGGAGGGETITKTTTTTVASSSSKKSKNK